MVADRCPASAPLRPDPQPGGDGQGIRLARERDVREGHPGTQHGHGCQQRRRAGQGREHADRSAQVAVRCGGGYNHRIGLYDGVMIKDNHITAAGSIKNAVEKAKASLGHMVKIEVETENIEEVHEAIESGCDVIMFDNRKPDEVKEFVKITPEHIVTEASGGIGLHNLADYQNTGVDYISLGFLTHSVSALDISFNVEGGKK